MFGIFIRIKLRDFGIMGLAMAIDVLYEYFDLTWGSRLTFGHVNYKARAIILELYLTLKNLPLLKTFSLRTVPKNTQFRLRKKCNGKSHFEVSLCYSNIPK